MITDKIEAWFSDRVWEHHEEHGHGLRRGGWQYFTEGHVAVRVPSFCQNTDGEPPTVVTLRWPAADDVLLDLPEDAYVSARKTCPMCDGEKYLTCPECESPHALICDACDGTGYVTDESFSVDGYTARGDVGSLISALPKVRYAIVEDKFIVGTFDGGQFVIAAAKENTND